MYSDLFSKLTTQASLWQSRIFSQKSWIKQHYPPDQDTLCSALTCFWLTKKLHGQSPLSQLETPDSKLLYHLSHLQALSYYPSFPPGFCPGEKEKTLLNSKYGTSNWKEIQQKVAITSQGDYLLYDLSQLFSYDSIDTMRFERLPKSLHCLASLPVNTGAIGVLRYLIDGQPSGHRIAYYFDRNHNHHLFDPDAGEVIEYRETNFHRWLHVFLHHTSYRALTPAAGDVFLTLYLFKNISPKS